ncbi:MAG: hypothetical protein ACLQK8_01325 [Streptosporangiaceae bacterium]|jgi:hypothetical protein|nr:hypothetical protein [Actinomycetota bacterium]
MTAGEPRREPRRDPRAGGLPCRDRPPDVSPADLGLAGASPAGAGAGTASLAGASLASPRLANASPAGASVPAEVYERAIVTSFEQEVNAAIGYEEGLALKAVIALALVVMVILARVLFFG